MNDFEMILNDENGSNYLLKRWLNFQLEKWGKKQSIENREKLVKKLDEYKSRLNYQALTMDDPNLLFNLIDMLD